MVGASEFINNKKRWCLWLVGISPAELREMPEVMNRVELCRADRATQFRETKNPTSYALVLATSSENRSYIPIGFLDNYTIPTNAAVIVPDATLYHFGVLTSNVHMAWMRAVCGRLKSDYDYSIKIVYNNFLWPEPTEAQKSKIEQTTQAILDARALYPDSSLADLYDEAAMPPELRKAHQQNDIAVMQAYGFRRKCEDGKLH